MAPPIGNIMMRQNIMARPSTRRQTVKYQPAADGVEAAHAHGCISFCKRSTMDGDIA
jgi:hypothetical protein